MKKRLLPFILAGALTAAFAAPAAATSHTCENLGAPQRGGAAGLAALITAAVNAQLQAGVNACDIEILNNSLNNLLQNVDVDVLNNVLNNSPILNNSLNNLLQNVDIVDDVTISGNVITVDVLSGPDFIINLVQ